MLDEKFTLQHTCSLSVAAVEKEDGSNTELRAPVSIRTWQHKQERATAANAGKHGKTQEANMSAGPTLTEADH